MLLSQGFIEQNRLITMHDYISIVLTLTFHHISVMYNFLLAEEQKKQKMFSHTQLGGGPSTFCCCFRHFLTCFLIKRVLFIFSDCFAMGKDRHSSRKSSRAVKRLEPDNKSPGSHSGRRNSNHASQSKSRSHSRVSANRESRGKSTDCSQQE